jgi:hypothetical protein
MAPHRTFAQSGSAYSQITNRPTQLAIAVPPVLPESGGLTATLALSVASASTHHGLHPAEIR